MLRASARAGMMTETSGPEVSGSYSRRRGRGTTYRTEMSNNASTHGAASSQLICYYTAMPDTTHAQVKTPKWALILGASSGFGEGAARALAQAGYDIVGVHLDRKAGLEHVAEIRRDVEKLGRKTQYFNVNAADEEKRNEILDELAKQKLNV